MWVRKALDIFFLVQGVNYGNPSKHKQACGVIKHYFAYIKNTVTADRIWDTVLFFQYIQRVDGDQIGNVETR